MVEAGLESGSGLDYEALCSYAEVHRLVDLIEYEVFEREPRPASVEEAWERWQRIAATIRQLSLEQLKTQLGI